MPRFTVKRYEALQQQMLARVITRGGLYDVGDTAAVKHICGATARAIDELYYQASLLLQLFSIDTAVGDDLDARAKDIQPATLQRIPAVKASGNVVFSRSVVAGSGIIPAGTQVKTAGNAVFATTTQVTLDASTPALLPGHTTGQDSPLTPVAAIVPGAAGNVAANTVVKFGSKPLGVDTVSNPAIFAHGQDAESDDAFRARLKNYVGSLARSTLSALESCVLGAQDPTTGATILYSKAIQDTVNLGNVTVYIDDGTGTAQSFTTASGENVTLGLVGPPSNSAVGGEQRLYLANVPVKNDSPITLTSSIRGTLTRNVQYTLDSTSGLVIFTPALVAGEVITAAYTYFVGLVALAQKIIDGSPTDRVNYPGYRAAGVRVVAATPQVALQTIGATLTVQQGYDTGAVQAAVTQAILNYINTLPISGDLLRAELFSVIMAVPGVVNVLLTSPLADVTILDNQLARTQSSNITVS